MSSKWQGTAVPNTGYVEKVYVNTDLSIEEVVNMVTQCGTEYAVYMYQDSANSGGGILFGVYDDGIVILQIIGDMSNEPKVIFQTTKYTGNDLYGWNPDIVDTYKTEGILINSEVLSEMNGYQLGAKNDILSSLFSITPFVEVKEKMVAFPKSWVDDLANAIREKEESTEKISGPDIPNRVRLIETGVDTTDATATSEDILKGKTAYVNEVKVEGAIETYDGSYEGNGENGDTLKNLLDYTKSCRYMFNENKTITDLTDLLPYDSTSNVTNFGHMFYNCQNLTKAPQLDTSNATDFSYMFYNCYALTTIPQLDTSSATNMSYMFYNCSKNLTTIPQLDTSNATDFSYMFGNCHYLTKIDITHYNISSTSYTNSFCNLCYNLKVVIIRSFGTSYVLNSNSFNRCYHILGTVDATYNPNGDKDGYIYVPRNMIETLSSATNWSTHATQFRALEDYTVDGTTTGEFDDEKAGLV